PIEAADELGISLNWAHKLLANRHNNRGDPAVHRQAMLARLDTDEARALDAKRKISVEPIFGNIKANLRCRRFSARGLKAVSSEWRFICVIHNLMKLRTMRLAAG
ncbi:MAG: transposase, partial [Acidimicrobiales bacterium]